MPDISTLKPTKEDKKVHKAKHSFGVDKSFDYDQITDYIYLGTNMCCQVGYSEELKDKDVKADVSLEDERIDNPYGVDYFLWLPTRDHYPPSKSQMALGVQTLNLFVENKMKVYVHCKNGHGRAPTLIAAYFVSQGMNTDEAYAFIKSKRPSIHPCDQQVEAVKKLEAVNKKL